MFGWGSVQIWPSGFSDFQFCNRFIVVKCAPRRNTVLAPCLVPGAAHSRRHGLWSTGRWAREARDFLSWGAGFVFLFFFFFWFLPLGKRFLFSDLCEFSCNRPSPRTRQKQNERERETDETLGWHEAKQTEWRFFSISE